MIVKIPRVQHISAVAIILSGICTPLAHADQVDDYVNTIAQHGVRISDNRDRVESIFLGRQVCESLAAGITPTAERMRLRNNGAKVDTARSVVDAAQQLLCPEVLSP